MASTGINAMLGMITSGKGMASSNNFALEVTFPNASVVGKTSWSYKGSSENEETRMVMFCDETSLPGYQLGTGSVNRYSGEAPIYYPTTPIYNDIQLSFMCDAYMTPVHLLNKWISYIFEDTDGDGAELGRRLRYPDEYQAEMKIYKTEKSKEFENGAISTTYTLFNAWPYSVDSIPLSYGSSQLVKVTANFYYRRWKIGKDSLKGR